MERREAQGLAKPLDGLGAARRNASEAFPLSLAKESGASRRSIPTDFGTRRPQSALCADNRKIIKMKSSGKSDVSDREPEMPS
jgi:hypothetical protein